MTLRLRRAGAGSYETADGRFSIYKDPSRAAGWSGLSWVVTSYGKRMTSTATLRGARRWLAHHLEQTKKEART